MPVDAQEVDQRVEEGKKSRKLDLSNQRLMEPGLRITRQVPCRCEGDCTELFDYENLRVG